MWSQAGQAKECTAIAGLGTGMRESMNPRWRLPTNTPAAYPVVAGATPAY
jgi:hypothetical protein